MIKYVQ